MNESALVPAELEAIQAAIRETTAPHHGSSHASPQPTSMASRVGASALLELATQWAEEASRTLRPHLPTAGQLHVTGVERIDSRTAHAEVQGAWITTGRAGERPAVLLAVHGAVIEAVAARRCGDDRTEVRRLPPTPSAAALRLFDPAGAALMHSWAAAWSEHTGAALLPSRAPAELAALLGGESLLRASLAWSGSTPGRCVIYVDPMAMATDLEFPSGSARAVVERLAEVPVEVRVELGTLQLSLEQVRQLQPGATFALSTFVDSRVPIFVGGVLKAWGTPVVHRGVLAVSVEQVVGSRGSRS